MEIIRRFSKVEFQSSPIGCTKKPILMPESTEYHVGTDCHISVDHPCLPVEKGGAQQFFKKYGFLVIKNIWDPTDLVEYPPKERGSFHYYKNNIFHEKEEAQVNGSLARYNHPKYRYIHSQIRLKIQKILKEELYNTYYYERFYFSGQRLFRHRDRDACEISLTYQVSSNSKKRWPIYFASENGEEYEVSLDSGDAILYLGCDREHWREPLTSRHNLIKKSIDKLLFKSDDTYHHQVFFHYVRANGERCHFAGDNR